MCDKNDKIDKETDGPSSVIPVIEERVTIGKKSVERRTVSVMTRPVVETQTFSVPLIRETVTVARVPVGRIVDTIPEIREEEDLTIIPVVEERAVITKQLVLTEEIHLHRSRDETTEEYDADLRRTDVQISE